MAVICGSLWLGNRARRYARPCKPWSMAPYGLTAVGISVQALYLEGRNRTSMEDIDKALGIKKGDPILQLRLSDVRDRLKKSRASNSPPSSGAADTLSYAHRRARAGGAVACVRENGAGGR